MLKKTLHYTFLLYVDRRQSVISGIYSVSESGAAAEMLIRTSVALPSLNTNNLHHLTLIFKVFLSKYCFQNIF